MGFSCKIENHNHMQKQPIQMAVLGGLTLAGAICAGAVVGALFTAVLLALAAATLVSRGAHGAVRAVAGCIDHGQVVLAPALSRPVFDKTRRLPQLRA